MKVGYVALIGRPNVGKSTLLNAMLGQKVAIISDKPQTTRISILGVKTTPAGQIIFIDNPGIHKPLHTLNKRMMNFVYSALETADVLCLLIDAGQKYGHGDEFVVETLRKVRTPLFLLINKVDAVRKELVLPIIDRYKDLLDFKEIIPISALRGMNLDVLETRILDHLPEAEKLYADDMVSDLSLRFRLAEIIREKLLKRVEEELPFVTAVLIERLEERKWGEGVEDTSLGLLPDKVPEQEKRESLPRRGAGPSVGEAPPYEADDLDSGELTSGGGKTGPKKMQILYGLKPGRRKGGKTRSKVVYVGASIFVEKDNHRKIVIGRHGKVIKEIGIESRREIEDILDAKVYLDLKVKVKPRWRDSASVLDLIEGQR
jgi:GTP-binding protein Era